MNEKTSFLHFQIKNGYVQLFCLELYHVHVLFNFDVLLSFGWIYSPITVSKFTTTNTLMRDRLFRSLQGGVAMFD